MLSKRALVRLVALAASCAMAVAVSHGSWLANVSASLDAATPGTWIAVACSDPRTTGFGTDVAVRLEGVAGAPSVRVSWPDGSEAPAFGQRVIFDSRLRAAVRVGESSGDSFRSSETLSARPWSATVVGWPPGPQGAIYRWRSESIAELRGAHGRGGDALASMLFGSPPEGEAAAAVEDARTAGVAWAITASGLHLGVIVLLAERLAGALGTGRKGRALAALVALGIVAAAAGLRLSLLRAALAAAAAVLARLVGRRRDATAALGTALAFLVIVDPTAAYDTGLLLGAAAVSGIALLSALAKAWLAPLVGRRAAWALGGSVAAQAAVAPLSAALFGAVSLLGPVTLVASGVPVQIAVALGAAGAIVSPMNHPIAEALTRSAALSADLATRIWQLAARVPGALLGVAAPPWWFAGVWIALGAALWVRWPTPRRTVRVRAGVGVCLAALVLASVLTAHATGCVLVMDIGQGDAILVRDGAQALLVDTGPDPVVLRQALARADVRGLTGVVLTHAHDDHTGGLDGLAGVARPTWIGVPDVRDDAVDALAERAAGSADQVVRLRRGMEFTVGSIKVRVLWPRGGEVRLSANDTSVILLLEKDGHYALLLGDAEEQAQRGALEAFGGAVELLKVAHHGSVNGNVPAALGVWRPTVALISVGTGNRFGHPADAALASLREVGASVHRTDLEGDLGWSPGSAPAQGAVQSDALCDNRTRGRPMVGLPQSQGQVEAWQQRVWPISSRSTSSTAPRSCSSEP